MHTFSVNVMRCPTLNLSPRHWRPDGTCLHLGRLAIRRTTYRGAAGYLVCGTDRRGRRTRIFTRTRDSAERIKAKCAAGQETTLADFDATNVANETGE